MGRLCRLEIEAGGPLLLAQAANDPRQSRPAEGINNEPVPRPWGRRTPHYSAPLIARRIHNDVAVDRRRRRRHA